MRKVKKLSFFLSVVFLTIVDLVFAQDQQIKQEVGNLTVKIIGIKNDSGDIKIGLFNTEESFNGKEEKFKGITTKAEKNIFIWSLENIPFGYYAIKVFHDEDQDDNVDTKFSYSHAECANIFTDALRRLPSVRQGVPTPERRDESIFSFHKF